MQITVGGEEYEWDGNRMSVAEARQVKAHTGMGVLDFTRGVGSGDPDAVLALVFLARRRAGEAVTWKQVENSDMDMVDVMSQVVRAWEAELNEAIERSEAETADDADTETDDAEASADQPEQPEAEASGGKGGSPKKTRGKTPSDG